MTRCLCILILILNSTLVVGQNEDRYWFFGFGSGLDFSTNPPVVLSNSPIQTFDYSSTISDSTGQLLFYTNGVSVWNKQHQIMTNGSGLTGSTTGGQSAIILHQPHSPLFYIFVVPSNGQGDLTYSIVDITLSGGLGAVIQKNTVLYANPTEKLTAIYNCIAETYWIISHKYGTNEFYTYSLSSAGLNSTPLISAIGNIHFGGTIGYSHDAMGQMTASPDQSILAVAQQFSNIIQLFDFNNANGAISNPRTIPMNSAWGVAFSPDNTKLYCTQWTQQDVIQIDITNPQSPGPPIVVGTTTGSSPGYGAGFLELTPNNHIYIAKFGATHLASINAPNSPPQNCQFIDNSIYLNGILSQAGLSRVCTVPKYEYTLNISQNCNTTSFIINSNSLNSTTIWDFGDSTISLGDSVTHEYQYNGTYNIQAITTTCLGTDTIDTTITIVKHLPVVSQIDGCNLEIQFLIQPNIYATIEWSFSDGFTVLAPHVTHTFPNTGIYTANIIATDSSGCIDSIQTNVNVAAPIITLASYTIDTCNSNVTFTNNSTNFNNCIWHISDGTTDTNLAFNHHFSSPGTYYFTLINFSGNCIDSVSGQFQITNNFIELPNINQSSLCELQQEITITNDSNNYNYIWYVDSMYSGTSPSYSGIFSSYGIHSVSIISINSLGCSDTLNFNFTIHLPPIANFQIDSITCDNQIFLTNTSINSTNYFIDFGNGTAYNFFKNNYTYIIPADYNIILTASNGFCSDTSSLIQTIHEQTNSQFYFTGNCNNQTQFVNQSTNQTNSIWEFGDGTTDSTQNPTHQYPFSGNYQVSLTAISLNGCIDISSQIVAVFNTNPVSISTNLDSCSGNYLFTYSPSFASENIEWSFGDNTFSNSQNAVHSFEYPGKYQVQLIRQPNSICADTSSIELLVLFTKQTSEYIPNSFSPNHDHLNDIFQIPAYLHCSFTTIEIYNRWGKLIFKSSEPIKGWDGTYSGIEQPEGIYIYLLNGKGIKSGTVLLIR